MNSSASLERGYRRLLAFYPRAFRRDNEEEILAVLLATAGEGQQRPGLAISADLIRSGVLMRLRPTVPRSAHTVRAAVTLVYLAAVAEMALLATVVLTAASAEAEVRKIAPAQLSAATTHIVVDEIGLPVSILLVLWLAWAIGRRQDWARLVLTAYFGLTTLSILFALAQDGATIVPADMIASGVFWLFLLAAVVLIFTPQSARYYQPQPTERQAA
jgi:hypothetical protein